MPKIVFTRWKFGEQFKYLFRKETIPLQLNGGFMQFVIILLPKNINTITLVMKVLNFTESLEIVKEILGS